MRNFLIAVTIAVLCTEVDGYVCRTAGRAVDAWNEAAGRKLFEMSETHPAHGQKVMLTSFFEQGGDCGRHGTLDGESASVIYVNLMNPRCRVLPVLLHELGHRLGLPDIRNPSSPSIMRDPMPKWVQRKPAPIDVERLNAIRAGDGAD